MTNNTLPRSSMDDAYDDLYRRLRGHPITTVYANREIDKGPTLMNDYRYDAGSVLITLVDEARDWFIEMIEDALVEYVPDQLLTVDSGLFTSTLEASWSEEDLESSFVLRHTDTDITLDIENLLHTFAFAVWDNLSDRDQSTYGIYLFLTPDFPEVAAKQVVEIEGLPWNNNRRYDCYAEAVRWWVQFRLQLHTQRQAFWYQFRESIESIIGPCDDTIAMAFFIRAALAADPTKEDDNE